MARTQTTLTFKVRNETSNRRVVITAFDTVGVEDAYDVLFAGALHRLMTGENLVEPIPREVKDWLIKTNLFV